MGGADCKNGHLICLDFVGKPRTEKRTICVLDLKNICVEFIEIIMGPSKS